MSEEDVLVVTCPVCGKVTQKSIFTYSEVRCQRCHRDLTAFADLGVVVGIDMNKNTMDVHTFAKTVNALKISPYELLLELEEPERNPEVVSLIFELGRLEHKKQKVVLETMKAMINSLSSME